MSSKPPLLVTIPLESEQPTCELWPTTAHALKIRSRTTINRLAREGKLPIEAIPVGSKYVVRTRDLRQLLRLDEPVAS